ncbi:DNA-binding protein [Chelonobacter oris]|uniref:single-stranded DNA-binding protein n=1 Tax=Chelonobacter oris TaxID=505317 RepID=UPI002448774C|nr:single-stranded DNA-binding protein [Chelonobacter oris]MDH3001575.1 DNA-binding protein [Chelonobacter oris]
MTNVTLNENYLLKVQVFESSKVEERSGVSQKTGKNWIIRTQEAYINLGGQFPVQIKLRLQGEQLPYLAGFYYVHPQSFKVNAYHDLQVGDIVLIPIDEK